MILTIARKEILETTRDGRFRLAFCILLGLLLVAVAFGWQARQALHAERQNAQAEDGRVWRGQGARNPHSAAHFGRYLFKPTTPLVFLDQGLTNYLGSAAYVEAHTQTPSRHRPAEDAGELARFGELTAAGVLQVLTPLVIVLLSFGGFAAERESGTLRQLLSLGVEPRKIVLGKALGNSAAWLGLLVPVTMGGCVGLLLSGPEGAMSMPRLLSMMTAYLLYFGAFLGISLTVSALARSSQLSLIVLLSFWIGNCLLVPRLASDLADRLYPVPATQEFFAQVTESLAKGLNGHDSEDKRLEELKSGLLAKYKVTRVQDLPVNFDAIAMQEGEEHGNVVLDHHYRNLWEQYERQARTQRSFSAVAPLLALRPFSMAMAGADLSSHREFTEAAEQYRRGFIRTLNNHMRDNSKTGDWNWKADPTFWNSTPEFQFELPSLSRQLQRELASLAILGTWCLTALGAAVWAARRVRGGDAA